jgi:hypothetical protein
MMREMRDTKYARELVSASIPWPDSEEARIERLHIKEHNQEEIRFSWWKDGNIVMRPLDLEEKDLLLLFEDAVQKNVFSQDFLLSLRKIIGD